MSTLTTERLTLVRWREEHLVELLVMASDERVVQYIVDGRPWSREYATDRHHAVLAHWKRHGYGWRAVLDRSGTFIGVASMTYRSIDEIEIGWWVAPAMWGQGIATELAAALRDEAFEQHGVRRVLAGHQDGNDASGRVMRKIGMVHDHSAADPAQDGRLVHVYVTCPPT